MKALVVFLLIILHFPCVFSMEITIEGLAEQVGLVNLPEGSRLNDAVLQALPSEQAYFLGSSWERAALKETHKDLKLGILFDLMVLKDIAILDGNASLQMIAIQLYEQIRILPVTGRQVYRLEPAFVMNATASRLLEDHDQLFWASRPKTIKVIGAITKDCTVAYKSMETSQYYVNKCILPENVADKDYVWVIQPDGRVFRQGIAMWNLDEDLHIAAGARIYVPIKPVLLQDVAADMNGEIAKFLATQRVSDG